MTDAGPYTPQYLAFIETITSIRPRLHRYCARMTGSWFEAEDIVQDALLDAYRNLHTLDANRPAGPWLFRIVHNRSIDALRQRKRRRSLELEQLTHSARPPQPETSHAIEHLVLQLPPLERACLLLKEVFDYEITEIAELTGSTPGGVKAALHRGRTKLANQQPAAAPAIAPRRRENKEQQTRILAEYVERFNQRDWDGVRALITADARLEVVDRYRGPLATAPYFTRYENLNEPWRLVFDTTGDWICSLRLRHGSWTLAGIVRVEFDGPAIAAVTDYSHCPWISASVSFALPQS